jgi:hypothetical protein
MEPSLRLVFNDGPGIAVSFPNDTTEDLLLTHVEGNHYRVESSSWLSDPRVFYGDIIEVNPKGENSADFVRIVKRSGFRVSCCLVGQKTIESPLFQVLLNKIMQVGGNWERAFGGGLIVHLPAAVDFDVDLELQTIAHSNEGNP